MLSNVRGVRLLWEEDALDAIGAFCVGAFVLGAIWMVLEGVLGASPFLSGAAAALAAVWTLGEISRQRYPERRSYSSRHLPAGARSAVRPYRVEGAVEVEAEGAPASPDIPGGTSERQSPRASRAA